MNNTYNKFLIFLSAVILLSGVYYYLYNSGESEASNFLGSLSSSLDDSNSPSGQVAVDTSFLSSLSSIKKINIDTSFFSSQIFNSFKDNSVELSKVESGRNNPFAPIEGSYFSSGESPIMTNEPIQVTATSAVLSGAVDSTVASSNTYFEYGPTKALGKITKPAELSLIGVFTINIDSLSPKTDYYFRAVARVNGAPIYGDVVMFTTN